MQAKLANLATNPEGVSSLGFSKFSSFRDGLFLELLVNRVERGGLD